MGARPSKRKILSVSILYRQGRMIWGVILALLISVSAVASPEFSTERVSIELVAEGDGLPADGGTVWLALRQQIIPHWHTYWRNPGDSGEPTDIEWALPNGFSAGEIHWPPPERLPYGPLVNFGFSDESVLLIPLTVPAGLEPGTRVTLTAAVYWLVCADVCIPEDGRVDLTLPVVSGVPGVNFAAVDVFARARENLPQPSPWAAQFTESDGRFEIALLGGEFFTPLEDGQIREVSFFPYVSGLIDNAAPQTLRYGRGGISLSTASSHRFQRDAVPSTIEGLIVIHELIGETFRVRSFTIDAPPGVTPADTRSRAAASGALLDVTIGQALLFALLGGLILNLMPCVFPVVFLKALTFVSVAHERPWAVRFHGLAYTGGILVTFSAIALLLIGLKAAGAEIGWGFQLQSPPVVAGLALLLFAVGLNLSGVYTVGASIMGLGGSLAERNGLVGSFFTGVLAVLVASPCTAPFMAAALGFALVQPSYVALGVFLALGLGLALPYLALSFMPPLLRLLPKPGAWMERFKQFLALPMYGAVAWLVWVLAQQVDMGAFALMVAALAVMALGAWIFDASYSHRNLSVRGGVLLIALVMAVSTLGVLTPRTNSEIAESGELVASVPYTRDALEAYRDEDRQVFVNFTAAWCITCLVNERVVFSDPDIAALFEQTDTIYMKGDWTNRNAEIAHALEQFGRSGVPLYVIYRPGEPPRVLPQVLTRDIVRAALAGE